MIRINITNFIGGLLFLIFSCAMTAAQTVFLLENIPADTPPGSPIYISGNFEGWTGGQDAYRLTQNDADQYYIIFNNTSGSIQFKFTRGSWATVEKGPNGEEIANRQYTFTPQPDTVLFTVHSWAGGTTGSTAADNVVIMDNAFSMQPYFNRTRTIRLYLPPSYDEQTDRTYPVLYMHDGQNLFDQTTSFAGEWEVDETLNRLYEENGFELIVVGIDNGSAHRIAEYTPWPHPQHGGGDGTRYVQFITEVLKPYIDQQYRTRPERKYTGIMGSSLGGLIAHYGLLSRPDIFSKAGVFSPSFWFSDSIFIAAATAELPEDLRIYMMGGGAEGGSMVPLMEQMHATLINNSLPSEQLVSKVVPGGQHNEGLWRSEFEEAVKWLFQDIQTSIQEKKIDTGTGKLNIYPNPGRDNIYMDWPHLSEQTTATLIDVNGKVILQQKLSGHNQLMLPELPAGSYLLRVSNLTETAHALWIRE